MADDKPDPIEKTKTKFATLKFIAVGILALSALSFLAWSYFSTRPEGDATVIDKGIISSYPRYEVRFPNISLKKPGTYIFVCKGLPHEKLRLFLEMPDAKRKSQQVAEYLRRHPDGVYQEVYDEKKHKAIKGNRTIIAFMLVGDGQTIANVTAPLSAWRLQWYGGTNTGEFYRYEGDIVFHPNVKYEVTFEIKEVDPDGIPSELSPSFKGGGFNWTPTDE